MTKTAFTTILGAIVVLASVPSAFAASPDSVVTRTVTTAGLDLRTTRGARSMLQRIEIAASAVCGGAPSNADLDTTHEWQACVSDRVSLAVTQLGSPMVAEAAHQSAAAQIASNGR